MYAYVFITYMETYTHAFNNTTNWCLRVYGSQHVEIDHLVYLFPDGVFMYFPHLHLVMARCKGMHAPCMSVDTCMTEIYIGSNTQACMHGYI